MPGFICSIVMASLQGSSGRARGEERPPPRPSKDKGKGLAKQQPKKSKIDPAIDLEGRAVLRVAKAHENIESGIIRPSTQFHITDHTGSTVALEGPGPSQPCDSGRTHTHPRPTGSLAAAATAPT